MTPQSVPPIKLLLANTEEAMVEKGMVAVITKVNRMGITMKPGPDITDRKLMTMDMDFNVLERNLRSMVMQNRTAKFSTFVNPTVEPILSVAQNGLALITTSEFVIGISRWIIAAILWIPTSRATETVTVAVTATETVTVAATATAVEAVMANLTKNDRHLLQFFLFVYLYVVLNSIGKKKADLVIL
jgi:hypothetical protein